MIGAFDKIIDPFPPVGEMRVWGADYLSSRAEDTKLISGLKWEKVCAILQKYSYQLPETSGVYLIVRTDPYRWLAGINMFSYVVYVGKTENLRDRFKCYCRDKTNSNKTIKKNLSLRKEIDKMFSECGDNLVYFYSEVRSSLISDVERNLIEICDPMFNTEHRISEEKVKKELYGSVLKATIEEGAPAFF